MRLQHLSVTSVLLCALASPVAAQEDKKSDSKTGGYPLQIPFSSTDKPRECAARPDVPTFKTLLDNYRDWRKWETLRQQLRDVLGSCMPIVNAGGEAKPLLVTLVDGTKTHNVVLGPDQAPYSQTLRGVKFVSVVVLMSPTDAAKIKSIDLSLVSTATEGGLAGQLPDFVKSIVSAYAAGLGKMTVHTYTVSPAATDRPSPMALAYVPAKTPEGKDFEIEVPFRRGSIVEVGAVEFTKKDAKSEDDTDKAAMSFTYVNTPPAHAEFMAIAGAFSGRMWGHDKMKVDSGRYAADPLARAMAMAAIAFRPSALDPDGVARTEGQRWTAFAGGVLTPAPGVGLGFGRTLIKNLAVTFGWAAMWVPSAPAEFRVGDDVRTDDKQLVFRWTHGFFIGGGFAFGGK